MRPGDTTLADEQARHARLIARLRTDRRRRLQHTLDRVTELWAAPAYLRPCLGNWVHWQVRPEPADVEAVARHACDPDPGVRRATFAALAHAGELARAARDAIASGLDDEHPFVRLLAARSTARLGLGATLEAALVRRLDDALWTTRWLAASALAGTASAPRAREALQHSRPRPDPSGFTPALGLWTACLEALDRRRAR